MIKVLTDQFVTAVSESVCRLSSAKESAPKVERPKGHRGRLKGQSDGVSREDIAADLGLNQKDIFILSAIAEVAKGMTGYSLKKGCGIVKDKPVTVAATPVETAAA